ncbi:MAG: glycosyltransferase family 4 protein [Bacteroidia bacterium]
MEGKTAYLHGRPGPHPMHGKFAEAVGGEFSFIDFRMRWQDRDRSLLYRVASWFVCAFTFPEKKKYRFFLVDNLHFSPVIMKMFGLISKDQKIIAHMGSHTLYFMYANKFSKLTNWAHVQALKRYDILICEGEMAEELVKKILGNKTPKLYTIFNGIPEDHFPNTGDLTKNINGKNILFMGHGPNRNRLWYKGLDVMMEAFVIAYRKDPSLTFTIVGNWDEDVKDELLTKCDDNARKAVLFAGQTIDLKKYAQEASLYLHCARGEAYGLTILIALSYGIPALVSEWTGAKEVVNKVDTRFIVEMDKEKIAEKIHWYFSLSQEEKKTISEKAVRTVAPYTEKNSIDLYKATFKQIEKDFSRSI